jgi:hypothetical protein
MSTPLHRMTVVTALACALLAATMTGPAAARPADPRTEAQTSSLAGMTTRQDLRNPDNRPLSSLPSYPVATPPPRQDLRSPDARDATRPNEIELALERYYSTYGEPEPLPVAEAPAPADEDTPWLPIVIALAATLTIVAASATHRRRLRVRRRRTARAVS